ncbi:MAG TPA: ZIP family metal transporter [Candidatus Paceibacterota bacterium]|nr:ZIP family metal transporter [Candidatus Paceibacterota bacterium]
MIILIAIATFCATMLGGLFALKLRDHLHLILGFSAGAIIAVAFFDLLPEALHLGSGVYSTEHIFSMTVLGFVVYLILDRSIFLQGHHKHGHDTHKETDHQSRRGKAGALSLSLHSFLDGIGIGLAFHISPAVGAIIAAAVLTHDFSDGINTVNMILKHKGGRRSAFWWLVLDASTPVLGVLSTFFLQVPAAELGLLLALFAGFFLYIGATDLIPESYHAHPKIGTTVMTILGILVLYIAISIAG